MNSSWSGLKEREKIKLGVRLQEERKGLGAAKNRITYHLYYYFFLLKLKNIILILIHTSQVNSG